MSDGDNAQRGKNMIGKMMDGMRTTRDKLRNNTPHLNSVVIRTSIFEKLAGGAGSRRSAKTTSEEMIEEKIIIGKPKKMKHVAHMTKDDSNEWGINGLPDEWIEILKSSGISPSKVKEHQEEAMAALNVIVQERKRKEDRIAAKLQPLLSKEELLAKMARTTTIEQKNPDQYYKKGDKIGEGAGGVVFKVVHRATKETRAVKISPMAELEYIKNEIAYHAFSTHENIVTYHETFSHKQDVWIVMDLVVGGSLTDILGEDNPLEWTEVHISYTMSECLKGLDFMHKSHLLHRDIKSDNVLVDRDGAVKLADFGFTIALTKEKTRTSSTVGTPFWMPPEVIQGVPYDERCDIWSLGITALELVNHNPPHMDKSQVEALVDILTKPSPKPNNLDAWSEIFLDWIDKSLHKDFTKRLSAEKLLGHPFMKKPCSKEEFASFVTYNLDNREESDEEDEYEE